MLVHQTYCSAVTYQVDMCTCGALFRAVVGGRAAAQPGERPASARHDDAIARIFAGEACVGARAAGGAES
jgi:hypothetical protein